MWRRTSPNKFGTPTLRIRVIRAIREQSSLTGQPRAASVITNEPSSAFRLEKSDFDRLIANAPKLREALVNVASGYSQVAVREEAAVST